MGPQTIQAQTIQAKTIQKLTFFQDHKQFRQNNSKIDFFSERYIYN